MFEGKKIKIRAYNEKDTHKIWELISEKGIRETLSVEAIFPYSFENEKSFVNSAMNYNGELFNFVIEVLETHDVIGGCGINAMDRKNSVATIGIWLGKEYHGKGFASDTLRVLCSFIFDELNVNKVKLNYFDFNEAGKKCYESVGFIQEGVHRKEIFRYGKYHDKISMGLFKNEMKKSNKN